MTTEQHTELGARVLAMEKRLDVYAEALRLAVDELERLKLRVAKSEGART